MAKEHLTAFERVRQMDDSAEEPYYMLVHRFRQTLAAIPSDEDKARATDSLKSLAADMARLTGALLAAADEAEMIARNIVAVQCMLE